MPINADEVAAACHALSAGGTPPAQRAAADRFLQALRASPRPYAVCLGLLSTSGDPGVHFQMLAAIKEAVLREWAALGDAFVADLRARLLQFVVGARPAGRELPRFVVAEALHVVAVMYKRGWLGDTQALCATVTQHVQTLAGDERTAVLAMMLAKAVLDELSSSQSKEIGLAWGFHVECHCSFERHGLKPVFAAALSQLGVIVAALDKGAAEALADAGRVASTVAVVQATLNWEFDEQLGAATLAMRSMKVFQEVSAATVIKPGAAWADDLVRRPLLEMMLALYEGVCRRLAQAAPPPQQEALRGLLASTRDCVLQLASLRGKVFEACDPSGAAGATQAQTAFLGRLVAGAGRLAACVFAAPDGPALNARRHQEDDGAEVLALALLLQRISTNFPLTLFFSLPEQTLRAFFALAARLSVAVIDAAAEGARAGHAPSWAMGAFDSLLAGWGAVIFDLDRFARRLSADQVRTATALLADSTTRIFERYVRFRCGDASAAWAGPGGAGGGDDESDVDDDAKEHLEAVAAIGRVNAAHALGLLRTHLGQTLGALQQLAQRMQQQQQQPGGADVSALHERSYWLLRLLGHVLADEADGETPLIPEALMRLSLSGGADGEAAADPLVAAGAAAFSFVAFQNSLLRMRHADARSGGGDWAADALLSPLVGETVGWFLARWAATYVYPQEALYPRVLPAIWRVYGEGSEGAAEALDFLLGSATTALVCWGDDADVASAACRLLRTLIGMRRVCARLHTCPSWQTLLQAYTARPASSLFALSSANLSAVVTALCEVAGGASSAAAAGNGGPGAEASAAVFAAVVEPVSSRMNELLSLPDFQKAAVSQRPAVVQQLLVCIDLLRGVGVATGAGVFERAYAFVSGYFTALVSLVRVYADSQPSVTLGVFSLLRDMAEADLVFLEGPQVAQFADVTLRLVTEYAAAARRRLASIRTVAASAASAAADDEEQFEDVLALLRLLGHCVTLVRQLGQAGEAGVGAADNVADAVLLGLSALLPSLDASMLSYPEILIAFFYLVRNLAQDFPAKFARLPEAERAALLMSVHFSVTHHHLPVAKAGYAALKAIGVFHASGAGGACFADACVRFQPVLLEQLLLGQTSPSLLDHIADALFPLIVAAPPAYEATAQAFIAQYAASVDPAVAGASAGGDGAAEARARLTAGFAALIQENGLTQTLTRANYTKFRANLRQLVLNVRSFVQCR